MTIPLDWILEQVKLLPSPKIMERWNDMERSSFRVNTYGKCYTRHFYPQQYLVSNFWKLMNSPQKYPFSDVLQSGAVLKKNRNIHRDTSVCTTLFNKAGSLLACSLIKKSLHNRCFNLITF